MGNNKKYRKEKNKMTAFTDFVKANEVIIRKLSERNVVRNNEGKVVITKDDEWRNETEWDELRKELKRDDQ